MFKYALSRFRPSGLATIAIAAIALVTGFLLARGDRVLPGLVGFALLNAVLPIPGTQFIRATTILLTLIALVVPGDFRTFMVLAAWLFWPSLLMFGWGFARIAVPMNREAPEVWKPGPKARGAVAGVIVAVALASLVYRIITSHELEQTAALFVGLPSLIAIIVTFAVSPRSAMGVAFKAVTVGLLVSLLLLDEGILCVLMSAPLFYLVALAIGASIDLARDRTRSRSAITSCLLAIGFVPMSLEGVTPGWSFNRNESVSDVRVVNASVSAVQQALVEPPRFGRTLPLYLRAGFPRPVAVEIDGDAPRRRWVIRMRGGEMRLNGLEPRPGDLVLELEDARPGFVRWRAISDDSHMTHFLDWRGATVSWEPVGPDRTRITWTLHYRRGLDPSWYFGPWERYAVKLAARYLIDAVATP